MKPLLLLDVDGVLSPLPRRTEMIGEELIPDGWRWVPAAEVGMGFNLPISDWLREQLAQLAELYELRWATTWGDDANRVISRLYGLPQLPVLETSGAFPDPLLSQLSGLDEDTLWEMREWPTPKLAAIAAQVEPERALAWAEDTLSEDAYAWAAQRPAPTLLIKPDKHTALDIDHIIQLREFAAANPEVPNLATP